MHVMIQILDYDHAPKMIMEICYRTNLTAAEDMMNEMRKHIQWVDLRENLQETIDFPMKIMVFSCNFSLKPIN